jgi:excisionase family DNA binding protein
MFRLPCIPSEPIKFNAVSSAAEKTEPIGVNARQAAKMLNISEPTLRLLTKQGKIPSVRIGSRIIYSLDNLRKLAAGQSATSSPLHEIMAEYYFIERLLQHHEVSNQSALELRLKTLRKTAEQIIVEKCASGDSQHSSQSERSNFNN